jgi:hypothetical protein
MLRVKTRRKIGCLGHLLVKGGIRKIISRSLVKRTKFQEEADLMINNSLKKSLKRVRLIWLLK